MLRNPLISFYLGCLILLSCKPEKKNGEKKPENQPLVTVQPVAPDFQADSAYAYIAKQLAFGPRIPNLPSHSACGDWLMSQFKQFRADTVMIQKAVVSTHDKKRLNIRNIIASFNPVAKDRIFISAHWDSRPYADEDSVNQFKPIPAANDGASGVAIVLEVARQLGMKKPEIGVDLILWDAEDLGKPDVEDSYCLGSQYWAKNPHLPGYKAKYGINLDMVGAKNAMFPMEGYSLQYARSYTEKVWNTAAELGYAGYFMNIGSSEVIDDHLYINRLAGIPTLNIIHRDPQTQRFFEHWHTHQDDIQQIDPATLKAVGQTVLEVIYREKPSQ